MPRLQSPHLSPPLPRCYWVLDGLFLAGAYAGQPTPEAHQKRLTGFFQAGLRTFISLMEADETDPRGRPFVPYAEVLQTLASKTGERVECFRFPIVDQSVGTHEQMEGILDAIDSSIAEQRPVYLHCFGGTGRTGTAVCCWLLRHQYATEQDVFATLRQLRQADVKRAGSPSPENESQRKFVLAYPNFTASKAQPKPCPPATGNDWFTKLTGFSERSPAEVRENLVLQGQSIRSRANGASYQCGRLEILSLESLRARLPTDRRPTANLRVSEVVGDAQEFHKDLKNAGAAFQVASQFNLLEMISPSVTPEKGIAGYENDRTQGPACAVACGAGTIFRNYFVELDGQLGQTENRQVDCLRDLGVALGNTDSQLWTMKNGYALPTAEGLDATVANLASQSEPEREELRAKLKVGVQWNTQVTLSGCEHWVTQIYCSALPVAYSGLPGYRWEPFARLILEAAYEATLAAAVLNAAETGNNAVYLTMLGGGAFGNDRAWILDAIRRACGLFRSTDLDVKLVSYGRSNPAVTQLAQAINLAT